MLFKHFFFIRDANLHYLWSIHTQPDASRVFVMVLAGPTELLAFLRQLIWWRISWIRFGVAKGERPCWLVSSQPVLNGGVYLSVDSLSYTFTTCPWPMKDWMLNNASFLCVLSLALLSLCAETVASSTEHCCQKHYEQEWFPLAGHLLHPPPLCRRLHI